MFCLVLNDFIKIICFIIFEKYRCCDRDESIIKKFMIMIVLKVK